MLRYLRFLLIASATLQKAPEANPAESNHGCSLPPDFTREDSTTQLLTSLCTGDNFPAMNKPPVRVGILNAGQYKGTGQIAPFSCVANPSGEKCPQEIDEWIKHKESKEIKKEYFEMKKEIENRMQSWEKKLMLKKKQAMKKTKITPAQLQKFDAIYEKQLHYLKNLNVTSQVLIEYHLGNCGEQLAYSAIRLYEQAQKCNLNIRIQVINLSNAKAGNQHAFLLINSDAKDTVIENNAAKIAQYLKNLKKSQESGTICDLYNEGLLVKFGADRSNLYDENGQWTTMTVETLGIDLEKTQDWPPPLKEIIDNEMVELGLEQTSVQTKTCSL